MTDQAEPGGWPPREKIALEARVAATSAVLRVARQTGTEIVSRPVHPGAAGRADYAEPGAGLRIARSLELAAASVTSSYIRFARETGLSWQDIGTALELAPAAAERGIPLSAATFEFAAGPPSTDAWQLSVPAFRWTCLACEQAISDYGPSHDYPEDSEHGHRDGCRRLAADVAAWRDHWASESQD